MTETSGSPAGWHPDPTGQFEQRYWDGSQWTEHVHHAGVQSVSALSAAAPTQAAQQVEQAASEPAPVAEPRAAEPFRFQTGPSLEPDVAKPEVIKPEVIQLEPVRLSPIQPQQQAIQPDPISVLPEQPQQQEPLQQQPVQQQQPVASGPPAGWHPDPTGQFEQRYWDGMAWTEHVAHQGRQGVSPLNAVRPVQTSSPEQVQRQVQQQAGLAAAAGGSSGQLMDEPVLVVNQKAKLIEITQEFAVYDQAGNQLGSVVQVGQSSVRKVLRFVSNVDQFLTHKFEVRDQRGAVLMTLVRPAKLMKSKVVVSTPTGQEIGVIRQENVLGKIRFAFEVNGQRIGGIQAENWRAWNFSIVDAGGQEVARITKTWEGVLKAAFTTADNYVIQIHHRLPEPLRSMVVASALTVDTALKQDSQ